MRVGTNAGAFYLTFFLERERERGGRERERERGRERGMVMSRVKRCTWCV